MKLRLLSLLALNNLKSRQRIVLPFILAASVMFGLEYIMLSLMKNDYINKRHETLPMLMTYANVLSGILSVIFVLYANRFVIKQRKQEFALNMVLGMEKRHIRIILLIETLFQMLIVSILSLVGGYLFGNLIFMTLNKLVKGSGMTLMDYPFELQSAMYTLLMIAALMLLMLLYNIWILSRQNPMQLMQGQKAGEKQSRKWVILLLMVVGALLLGFGYYIAISTEGVLSSLQNIFIAVLVVTGGTYCLFMSLTLFILQTLQRMPNYYYRPKQFLSISGLLSRMRANAVSLASITMLCTFLIVTLGMSLTTYRGFESQVNNTFNEDFVLRLPGYTNDISAPKKMEPLINEINRNAKVDRLRFQAFTFNPMLKENGELKPLLEDMKGKDGKNMVFTMMATEKGYNDKYNKRLNLRENEIAVSSNADRLNPGKSIVIDKKKYIVVPLKHDVLGMALAADGYYIVVKDIQTMKHFNQYFAQYNSYTNKKEAGSINTELSFNVIAHKQKFVQSIPKIEKKYKVIIEQKDAYKKDLYELNGGLIFIGIVVATVLLTGMFLMLYYKQLSEGYEDRRNYQIMKKVGLPDKLIKKTINTQILWLFVLPIGIGVIHTLFASKIIFQLLGILSIRDNLLFATSYGSVILAIMIVYGIMYMITSSMYYKIINE